MDISGIITALDTLKDEIADGMVEIFSDVEEAADITADKLLGIQILGYLRTMLSEMLQSIRELSI